MVRGSVPRAEPNSATVCNLHSVLADLDADEKTPLRSSSKTANSPYDF
jgi:hypothetical protein